MKFSYNILQELIDKQLPPTRELAEQLTLHSFECEGVEERNGDVVLDLDILPNRAHDCASHLGVARDIAALIGGTLQQPQKTEINFGAQQDIFKVSIQENKACSRYCAVYMEGVQVKDSPDWLKQRLEALGLNSINNLVDIANYVMLVTGQPLHIFDYDKLAGEKQKQILVRNAKNGERVTGLDNNEYTLNNDMLVIADKENSLGIAGIKGGKIAEVDDNTTNIIIESAHFEPVGIRKTSRALGLQTDASWRFERNVPVCFTVLGIETTVAYIQSVAGGRVGGAVDENKTKENKREIEVGFEEINDLIGVEVEQQQVVDILKKLEFEVEQKKDKVKTTPPLFRLDVAIKQDVIEEVARMYGYKNVTPQNISTSKASEQHNATPQTIRVALTEIGFFELHNSAFIAKETAPVSFADCFLELQNPVNKEKPLLCPSPIFNIIDTAQQNIRYHGIDKLKFFEIGTGFSTYGERTILSLAIIQKKSTQSVNIFQEVQQSFLYACEQLGVEKQIVFQPAQDISKLTAPNTSEVELYRQYDTPDRCAFYPIHQLSLLNIQRNGNNIGGCGAPISLIYNREKYDIAVSEVEVNGMV